MHPRYRPIYQHLFEIYAQQPLGVARPLEQVPYVSPQELITIQEAYRDVSACIGRVQARLIQADLPPLREDAEFLLLTCFSQMIYTPLKLASDDSPNPLYYPSLYTSRTTLVAIIEKDIWTISSIAAENLKEGSNSTTAGRNLPEDKEGPSISAHQILDSLPTIWDKIKAGASRLWEGK